MKEILEIIEKLRTSEIFEKLEITEVAKIYVCTNVADTGDIRGTCCVTETGKLELLERAETLEMLEI